MSILRNRYKSIIAGTVAIVSMAVGLFTLDDRYCKAREKEQLVSELKQDISTLQKNLIQFKLTSEVNRLQDKIFELNLKVQQGVASPVDRVMLERYQSQLIRIPKDVE